MPRADFGSTAAQVRETESGRFLRIRERVSGPAAGLADESRENREESIIPEHLTHPIDAVGGPIQEPLPTDASNPGRPVGEEVFVLADRKTDWEPVVVEPMDEHGTPVHPGLLRSVPPQALRVALPATLLGLFVITLVAGFGSLGVTVQEGMSPAVVEAQVQALEARRQFLQTCLVFLGTALGASIAFFYLSSPVPGGSFVDRRRGS